MMHSLYGTNSNHFIKLRRYGSSGGSTIKTSLELIPHLRKRNSDKKSVPHYLIFSKILWIVAERHLQKKNLVEFLERIIVI